MDAAFQRKLPALLRGARSGPAKQATTVNLQPFILAWIGHHVMGDENVYWGIRAAQSFF
jgi:hypothetical protein